MDRWAADRSRRGGRGDDRRAGERRRRRSALVGKIAVGLVSALVLSTTAYVWAEYRSLVNGVYRSSALDGEAGSLNGDINILIMGLDSRLDENGNPLPPDIYNALHAGGASDGGENANVLMLLHVPANGDRATSISIPRDDYVNLPGCPDGQCKGKIKQAYGLAFDAKSKTLVNQHGLDSVQRVQQERDAARKEEIDTVRQLLSGLPVDHFAEVTLVSFFQIAQVVQPITVCVNENTQDSYSGANFHQGQQQINASQAVAFVRQRRDYVHPELNFTDLDRERRQQAFIASLAYQLKQGGVFTDPGKLSQLLNVAKQNIAVDSNLDLLSLARQASNLTGGNIAFYMLPIQRFGTDPAGEDVNIVNVPQIQALVRQLIGSGTGSSAASPTTTATSPSGGVVDVVNANGRSGLAGELERALAARGYTQGAASTASSNRGYSVIYYGAGEHTAASALSTLLGGMTIAQGQHVSAGHVRIVLGTDFVMPTVVMPIVSTAGGGTGTGAGSTASDGAAGTTSSSAGYTPAAYAVDTPAAPGGTPTGGVAGAISGGGIPCVK